jgi:rare lipoprotein A
VRASVGSSVSALLLVFSASLLGSPAKAEKGYASYYRGRGHHGAMTCAHRTRPFGSVIRVTYRERSVSCVVNDRGPFIRGRVIDLSIGAARALGMTGSGIVFVSLE